jgi:phosphoribosyl-AMP cyclohydrolase
MSNLDKIIETIKFNEQGLVPAIAQDSQTKQVLMMAWMNAESLKETMTTNKMCYFSRSRNSIWRKGETSGQIQTIKEIMIDCDSDAILALVEQKGVACHTGRKSCFYKTIVNDNISINQEVLIAPEELYND